MRSKYRPALSSLSRSKHPQLHIIFPKFALHIPPYFPLPSLPFLPPFSPSLLSLPLLFHPSFPLPSSSFLLCSSTNSLPSSAAKSAIDVSYHVFTDERGYPPEVRRAAAERVCMTLLRSCSEVALREFFLEHIGDIMATVEANLSKVEDREIFL